MNISNVSRSLEIYQNSIPSKPVNQTKKPASMGNDTMVLSQSAKDFNSVMDALKKVPDYDSQKVADLKERIDNNNYAVNADKISEQILKMNFDAIV